MAIAKNLVWARVHLIIASYDKPDHRILLPKDELIPLYKLARTASRGTLTQAVEQAIQRVNPAPERTTSRDWWFRRKLRQIAAHDFREAQGDKFAIEDPSTDQISQIRLVKGASTRD